MITNIDDSILSGLKYILG